MFVRKVGVAFVLVLFVMQGNVKSQVKKSVSVEKPKLIVCIVVDQMRYDFLYRYASTYCNNGFKRLMNEGTVCKNATYENICTLSEPGYATLSTGSNPSLHGIIASEWFQSGSKKKINCVVDASQKAVGGSFESGQYSPKQLLSPTIGDELRLSNNRQSKVISVSLNPAAAVLLGGHMANQAWWFDPSSGSFATSSYYMESLPGWVEEFNRKKLPDTYLQRNWEPLLPVSQYLQSLSDDSPYETGLGGKHTFPYNLDALSLPKGYERRNYAILGQTPFGNSLTKDFAISALVNEKLGKGENTDILWVDFSATQAVSRNFGLMAMETQDAYLRLDEEIMHFLDFIDSYIGKGNVVVMLTSNHGAAFSSKYLSDNGLPSGAFSINQAASLLSSYLNARYGKGSWISSYSNLQFYFNRELIAESKLKLSDFQNDAAQFLLQFSGVANVLTSTSIENTAYDKGIFRLMQNSYNQKRSGDILLNLAPGWVEKNNDVVDNGSGYRYDAHVPLLWYGWKIPRQVVYHSISITDIAPTISSILDIAFPSGAQGTPISEIVEQ